MLRLLPLWLTLLAACAPATERVFTATYVPAELRRPVPAPMRPVVTNRDTALLIIDYDEALALANGQIVTIDKILSMADAPAGGAK